MNRPHPLLLLAIAGAVSLIGWLLWRDQGAMIWLSGFAAMCF